MKLYVLLFLIAATFFSSCKNAAEKFTPNSDNPYMEGKWVISEVDNSDALVSKQTLLFSIIEEDYIAGNYMVFKPGDGFVILSDKGDTLDKGRYGISDNNKRLQLYSPEDNKIITYAVSSDGKGTIQLNPLSPGDLTGLVIIKK